MVCDATTLAAPGVVAAGDVARWPSHRFGELMRVEHWDNAIAMGEHAARRLLADLAGDPAGDPPSTEPYDPVPWFWSDQYDRKIQLAGRSSGADEVRVVDGSTDERRFVALYRRGDRLVGVLAMNRPRLLMAYRGLVERGRAWDEALAQSAHRHDGRRRRPARRSPSCRRSSTGWRCATSHQADASTSSSRSRWCR